MDYVTSTMNDKQQNFTVCLCIAYVYTKLKNYGRNTTPSPREGMNKIMTEIISSGKLGDFQYVCKLVDDAAVELSRVPQDVLVNYLTVDMQRFTFEIFAAYKKKEDVYSRMMFLFDCFGMQIPY